MSYDDVSDRFTPFEVLSMDQFVKGPVLSSPFPDQVEERVPAFDPDVPGAETPARVKYLALLPRHELQELCAKEGAFLERVLQHLRDLKADEPTDLQTEEGDDWQERVDWMWDVHDDCKRRQNAIHKALRDINEAERLWAEALKAGASK